MTSHITLPARLSDELVWQEQRLFAQSAVLRGEKIFWEMDFGISDSPFSLRDSAAFFSFTLALEHFVKTLWEEFKEHTQGISLYRGGIKQDLFYMNAFAEYLHRLASVLPEELLPFCILDVSSSSSPARLEQLLSKERFPHIHLCLEGRDTTIASKVGVVLPQDSFCTEEVLDALDKILEQMHEPFRVVPEALLNEQWEDLDTLVVMSCALSPQGKRKLQGFCAAGGEVVVVGDLIGLSEERLWEEK